MKRNSRVIRYDFQYLLILFFILTIPGPAWAHTAKGLVGGFISGFTHPLFGLDHVVAMVAVGLWGGQLGKPAIWVLPVAFPVVMALGGSLGIRGIELPAVEIAIAVSGIVLGGMIAFAVRPPLAVAAVLVGFFAVFHGYAHGVELPQAANAQSYGIGFVIATGLLHLCGIVIGLLIKWKPAGPYLVRAGGGIISAVGLFFLMPHLG